MRITRLLGRMLRYRSDTEMKESIGKLRMIGRTRQRMTIVGKHDWQQCYNPLIESQCVICREQIGSLIGLPSPNVREESLICKPQPNLHFPDEQVDQWSVTVQKLIPQFRSFARWLDNYNIFHIGEDSP